MRSDAIGPVSLREHGSSGRCRSAISGYHKSVLPNRALFHFDHGLRLARLILRLALTLKPFLTTIISSERRKWNEHNWLTQRNHRNVQPMAYSTTVERHKTREVGVGDHVVGGEQPDLGPVDDDDQHVRRRGDARADPPARRSGLRDRPGDRSPRKRTSRPPS